MRFFGHQKHDFHAEYAPGAPKVRQEIEDLGGQAAAHVCDIRDEEQVIGLIKWVMKEYKTLHGLVNNAGDQFLSPAEFISKEDGKRSSRQI